jgi:hypothetical protein
VFMRLRKSRESSVACDAMVGRDGLMVNDERFTLRGVILRKNSLQPCTQYNSDCFLFYISIFFKARAGQYCTFSKHTRKQEHKKILLFSLSRKIRLTF